MSDLQKTPNATEFQARLDKEIDFNEFLAWIGEGKGYKRFAREVAKCSVDGLFRWAKATPERRAELEIVQESVAEVYVEEGERHLLEVDTSDKDTASANVNRARALDNHYRWKASKHGNKYADSVKLQGDKDKPLAVTIEKIERVIVDPTGS